MKIAHLQTKVETMFGLVDDEMNLVKAETFTLELPNLKVETFSKAREALEKKRVELGSMLDSKYVLSKKEAKDGASK